MILRSRPTRQFSAEMLSIYRYIASDNPDAAERFFAAVEHCIQRLTVFPRIGRLWDTNKPALEGMRVYSVEPYRVYQIFYRVVGKDLEVYRIVHGARDLKRFVNEIEFDTDDD